MRRLALTAVALVALAITANAVAASVPAWAWWTTSQAAKNVIRANPQRLDVQGRHTTVTQATCTGRGTAKAHGYRSFACTIRYKIDAFGDETGTPLYVTTSTAKRNTIACWSKFASALARGECRPPKIG